MREHIEQLESVMPLRRFRAEEINPWLGTCLDAAEEIGLGTLEDINDPSHPTGAGPMPLNAVGTTRWNAAFAYLDAARGRSNLTILDNTLADRVALMRDRATGAIVRRDGSELQISSACVVVTAGCYGSPTVLMRSGIGPEDELARHGITLAAKLPVGGRLRDHCSIRVRLAPSAGMQERIDEHAKSGLTFVSQGLARACSSQSAPGSWDLHLVVVLVSAAAGGFAEHSGHVLGLNAALVKPEWTGAVKLRSTDPAHLPVVTSQDLNSARDMTAILDGLDLCRELTRSKAARGTWDQQLVPDPSLSREGLRSHSAQSVATYFHPVGTCAMGRPGDGQSVVDASGRVHGFQNLYIADAAIMPTIPRANTNLPVLAAAERIAQLLAALD